MATRDMLTGLYALSALRQPTPVSADAVVFRIDLRDFSRVNVAYGLSTGGDATLKALAAALAAVVDPWPAYRLGGDEFAVLSGLPSEAAVRRLAERIRAALEGDPLARGTWTTIVAARAFPGATRADLLRLADEAMARARAGDGRSILVVGGESRAALAEAHGTE